MAALGALSGCSRREPAAAHSDWAIHTTIEFLSEDLSTRRPPLPLTQFRLVFPYIAGDLYGAPTTGDFVQAAIGPDYRLDLDLNASHAALLASLEPTDFSLSFLHIEPADARIARLAPMALQPDGIEQIGRVDWADPVARRPLLLVYVDRPARISGETASRGTVLRYDLRIASAGYVWVARDRLPDGDVYRVVARPANLILAVTPLQ